VIAGAGSISVYLYLYPGRLTRLELFQLFILAAILPLDRYQTSIIGRSLLEDHQKNIRATMASRVLLQQTSSRGALRLSPRISVPSASYLSNNFGTCNLYTNNKTSFRNIRPTRNTINAISDARIYRNFSTSTPRTKELATMSEDEVSGLRVKEDRLMRDLHETCEWGKGEVWGR
jgi:hypothetical protein